MRQSVAAVALVERTTPAGDTAWLAQWNPKWNRLALIGGHVEPGESFRDACTREAAEELELTPGRDFAVAAEPLARIGYDGWSASARAETRYTFELFRVTLAHPAALDQVSADADNCWLTTEEVLAGRSADRRPVGPTVFRLLTQAGVLAPPPADEPPFDLFLSYAHADNAGGWVTAFVDALRAKFTEFSSRRLRIFFDADAIGTGDDWRFRLDIGVKQSKLLVAVLSPGYFASEWCEKEWKRYTDLELGRRLPGEAITPVYLAPAPAYDEADPAKLSEWVADLRGRQHVDFRDFYPHGLDALQRDDVRLRLEELARRVRDRLERAERADGSPTTVPPHNPLFVGRRDELKLLRTTLQAGRLGAITAVAAVGGVGKTALAFEYANAFADQYPGGRYLVGCEGVDDLRAAFRQLVEPLGLTLTAEQQQSSDQAHGLIRKVLEDRGPALVLLDNVDRPDLLAPAPRAKHLPRTDRVHVLVTTRDEPPAEDGLVTVSLDTLPQTDGEKLLRKFRDWGGRDDEYAAVVQIVDGLGGHAQSLEIVGVYLWRHPEVTYAAYRDWTRAEGLLAAVDEAGGHARVRGRLSRQQGETQVSKLLEPTLGKLTADQLRALEYAALLPADWVPLPWLAELVREDFPTERKVGRPDPWADVVRELRRWRLVFPGRDPNQGRMHRVVQAVVLGRLAAGNRDERLDRMMAVAERRAWFVRENWVPAGNRWEIEPVRLLAMERMTADDRRGVELANVISWPIHQVGRYLDEQSMLQRAVPVADGTNANPGKLETTLNNLSIVERYLGNPAEARRLLRQAVEIGQKYLEPDHPTLAIRYSNLAVVEQDLGNTVEAQRLLHRAVEIDQKHFDPDHINLAIRYSNLAAVERNLGNLGEARRLLRRADEIAQKHFGPDHPNLATIYSNLAMVEQDLGDLPEARRLVRLAVEIGQKHFDPDHPSLATRFNNLARVEWELGNRDEARRLMRLAYTSLRTKLGDAHPYTCASRAWLEKHDPDFRPPPDAA